MQQQQRCQSINQKSNSLLNTQLNQLEKEKQTLKCRLCGSKIDVIETSQHSKICLKNSQTKKEILAMDQELVNLFNDSMKMRQKYRSQMNLMIVKQNRQIKNNVIKEEINEENSPSNTFQSGNMRKQRTMISQVSQEGIGFENQNVSHQNVSHQNVSLQQIDEDALSNPSQNRLTTSDSPSIQRINFERKSKKRVGTQIIASGNQITSQTSLPKQKLDEINEQKMEQFKKYGYALQELINYGNKVINANEQTYDIRNEIQLKQLLKQFKDEFVGEDEVEINQLVVKFDQHLEKRIEVTRQAQKYDQDLKHQSSLNSQSPDSSSSSAPQNKKLQQLKDISGTQRFDKGFKFVANKGKSNFGPAAPTDENKETPPQEGQEANISSPKPQEKKDEPKKKMIGGLGSLKQKLAEKTKANLLQQGSHQGPTDQIDQVLSQQISLNLANTTSSSIDSSVSVTTQNSAPAAEAVEPPKEEAPKKSFKNIINSKLKAKNSKPEESSNQANTPQSLATATNSESTTQQSISSTANIQSNQNTTNHPSSTVKSEVDQSDTLIKQPTQPKVEQQKQQPQISKLESTKRKLLKKNASGIMEEEEDEEDQDEQVNNNSFGSPNKKNNQITDIIHEDEQENFDSPLVKSNSNKRDLKSMIPDTNKQSSFARILGSTPQNPRKLDSISGTSSFEKLNNFKNLRDHNKKKNDGEIIPTQECQDQKSDNKQDIKQNNTTNIQQTKNQDENQDKQLIDSKEDKKATENTSQNKSPQNQSDNLNSIKNSSFENLEQCEQDSKVILEENETNSSVRFSQSTIGKVSDSNLPSDAQLNTINNLLQYPNSPNQSQQSLSLQTSNSQQEQPSSTTQSPSKDFSKNKQIKMQLQNLEQISPSKSNSQQTTFPCKNKQDRQLVTQQKLSNLQQLSVENLSTQKKNVNQLTISEETINSDRQEHLSTQEESPTDKANRQEKNDNEQKSRFFEESKSLKVDEEQESQQKVESNICKKKNEKTANQNQSSPQKKNSESGQHSNSNKKKKKKGKHALDYARLEDSQNFTISDGNEEDNHENDGEEICDQKKYKQGQFSSSSSSSDESDIEANQMIASLLNDSDLGTSSDSDESDKPAFMKIMKDKEQTKPEWQKSRFSFITPQIGSEDSVDNGHDSKNIK